MTETPNTAPEVQTGQAEGQGATQSNNWFDSFQNEDLGYIQNKGWNKPDGVKDMLNSYRNLEKLRGVPEDQLLKLPKQDDKDGWENVYRKLGKPENLDGYKADFGDMKLDESRVNWFNETAHKLNLNKAQHNELVKAAYEYENSIVGEHEKRAEQQRSLELKELKDSWGSKYDERIELGKRAVRAFVEDPTQIDKLEEALGSNSAVIRLFAKLGESIGEDKIPQSDSRPRFGYTKEQAQEDLRALKEKVGADKNRLSMYNKGVGDDYKEFQRLVKFLAE